MALVFGHLETVAEGLAAATAETLLQLVAASNHAVRIIGWGIYFNGATVTDTPVTVQLALNTTTGTRSSKSPVKVRGASETLQTTGFDTFTAEPTLGDVYKTVYVHPQGFYEHRYELGQEIRLAGAARLGITVTAPATVTANCYIDFEE